MIADLQVPHGSGTSMVEVGRKKPIVGLHQIGVMQASTLDQAQSIVRQMILRSLNTGRTIAFVGAGLSVPFGFPSWKRLLRDGLTRLSGVEPSPELNIRQLLDAIAQYDESSTSSKQHSASVDGGTPVQDCVSRLIGEAARIFKSTLQSDDSTLPGPRSGIVRSMRETLGIRRFVTTNYDPVLTTKLGIGDRRRLIATADNLGELWQFAVDAGEKTPVVFHCHGHADAPNSLIVVEPHYRRVYLGDSWEAKCYRRVMELIFDANPILFIGSSVVEEDVLRHLRTYLARESFVRRDRPVFALMPRWTVLGAEDKGDGYFLGVMRDRQRTYNIKTLFYDTTINCAAGDEPNWEDDATRGQVADALAATIEGLGQEWSDWSDDYQYKPSTRRIAFRRHKDNVVIRHSIAQKDFQSWSSGGTPRCDIPFAPRDHDRLCRALENGPGVLAVVGRRGTSKGTIGEWLVKEWEPAGGKENKFDQRVFVSAHFSNDLSTLIAGIVEALDPGSDAHKGGSLLDRLSASLRTKRALVVIGGFERLLQPLPGSRVAEVLGGIDSDQFRRHPIGTAATGEVQALLGVLSGTERAPGEFSDTLPSMQRIRSTVVITSSMMPVDWLSKDSAAQLRVVSLEGLSDADLGQWFGTPNCVELDKVVHATRGHAYGMSVVHCVARRGWPKASPVADLDIVWLKEVLRDLRNTSMDRRLEQLLRKTLERLTSATDGRDGVDGRDRLNLLKASALFTVPVSEEELRVAAEAIAERSLDVESTHGHLTWLASNRLLLEVKGGKDGGAERFTAHSSMRACVLQMMGSLHSTTGEPHALALEGFAKRLSEPHGGSLESEASAERVFERLHAQVEHREQAHPLLQGAAALLRGRWTATGIGHRNGDPSAFDSVGGRSRADAYHFKLVRLLNAIRLRSKGWYDYRVDKDAIHDEKAILYADELSWIYNEIGLVWYMQGALEDAGVAFRLGHDVNVVCEGRIGGPRWCQAEINLALVQIERGYLKRARAHLENVLRHCRRKDDEDLHGRVLGFLGLVMHLRGDGEGASRYYAKSIRISQTVGNERALSIFQRHRADLERKRGNITKARQCVRESIAAAEAGGDLDLFAYARIAEENLNLREFNAQSSGYECRLGDVRNMSQELGLPKLEAEACLVEGYGALAMGDLERAMELAVYCMGVCGGLGMRLRLSSAQVLLGRVLIRQHDRQAARHLLESVVETGRRFGYQTKIEEASGLLLELRTNR